MQLRVFFYPGVRRRKEVGGLAAIRGLGGGERSPSHSRCGRGGSSLRPAPCEDLRRVPTGQRTGDNQQRFIWLPASNMNIRAGLKYRVESLS